VTRNRKLILVLLALGFLFGSPGVASAELSSHSGYTYTSNSDCSWVQTTIRNDWARPHIDSVGTMDWWGNGRKCGAWAVAPTNAIAVRQTLIVWNQWTGQEEWCDPGSWVQNNWGPSHEVTTSWGWGSSPCPWASNWYYVLGRSGTWNNGWHGLNGWAFGTNWIPV
jgi:hypothetical protein